MNIAENKTIGEWEILEKKLKPAYNENWDEAYNFFELRICTRYLKPIEAILHLNTNNGEGFAIVTLQCSLIETIESFINGWIYRYPHFINQNGIKLKSNDKIFKSFFSKRSPFKHYPIKIIGGKFYKNVRCALLHETQTKDNWKIKSDTFTAGFAYEEINGGNFVEKTIYRENFQRDLKILISKYKTSIISGVEFDGISACELRENFISKFNHICKESILK